MEHQIHTVARAKRHSLCRASVYVLVLVTATTAATGCASQGPQGSVYTMAEATGPKW